MIADTVEAMEALDGCSLKDSSALKASTCWAATLSFMKKVRDIELYWDRMVWSSGGEESTKNREEQTNLKEARWVTEGLHQGMAKLWPTEWDSETHSLRQSCDDDGTTKWGADCE